MLKEKIGKFLRCSHIYYCVDVAAMLPSSGYKTVGRKAVSNYCSGTKTKVLTVLITSAAKCNKLANQISKRKACNW